MQEHIEQLKHVADGVSFATIMTAFFGWLTLPNIATGLAVVWTVLRIYQSVLEIRKLKKDK